MWVTFGKYKWTTAVVELAKDECAKNGKGLLEWLHSEYAAYRHLS